jgi:hypothetical protein
MAATATEMKARMSRRETVEERVRDLLPRFFQEGASVKEFVASDSFDDCAMVLELRNVELRYTIERGTDAFEVRPASLTRDWVPLSLLQMLLTGEDTILGVSVERQASFLETHLAQVQEALNSVHWPLTERQLHELGYLRAKRLFGYDPPKR